MIEEKDKSLQQLWLEEPLRFQASFWPHVKFYDKQVKAIHSVRDNIETIVPAGNMLGKDFLAAFVALWFFFSNYSMTRRNASVRIVTTSVRDDHLRVLWSEIARFASSSVVPLLYDQGGPLTMVHHELRHSSERKLRNPINYIVGIVSAKGEGLQGHHAANTLGIIDEASGVEQDVYDMMCTWAKRRLIIGNPNPCSNFFFKGVNAGDLLL